MQDQHKKLIVGLIVSISVGIGIAWAGAQWVKQHPEDYTTSASLLPKGGDFALDTATGAIHLSDFKDKVVVLYFGYTACPDVCPTSMATIKQAFNQLTPEQLQQVQGLLVSIDPERDTLDQVNRYAQYFHPNIRGASAQPDELVKITRQYDAFFSKVPMPNSALVYMMDHTSSIYVIDKLGKVRSLIEHAVPPVELADAIRALL